MSNHIRQKLTPLPSRKRKASDGLLDAPKPFRAEPVTQFKKSIAEKMAQPLPAPSNNRLLAGYFAHEFLTKGTLFGQKFDQARVEAAAASTASFFQQQPEQEKKPAASIIHPNRLKPDEPPKGYADVACLLKTDGAHIPSVYNPAQLARWLQMG
ncbi:hypothetical protein QJS10_CPA09g01982 [Acorus calamus]|uniref:Uncharacterized protein n=1 Tax=Acorus calamus TaxID=4465 RepID=A0AAV9E475_ACOCL|nr:hypothetical protein QJS10_CPA09g01982 [Acorus calamus]